MLGFCLNAFPCGSLEELRRACFVHAAAVRERLNALMGTPGAPMATGLWLGHAVAARLAAEPGTLAAFAADLRAAGLVAETFNAFPYDVFHGREVKTRVYVPDWAAAERLAYTLDCAQVLAALLPEGGEGTLSTVPVGYGPRVSLGASESGPDARGGAALDARDFPPERRAAAVAALRAAADALAALEARTGKCLRLALEPEPDCLLDDAPSVCAFYHELLAGADAAMAGRLRRHVGVCLDAAHAVARFDDSAALLAALTAAGVPVYKAQFACALETDIDAGMAARLRPYADGVYLHQSAWRRAPGAAVELGRDLPEALAALAGDCSGAAAGKAGGTGAASVVPSANAAWRGDNGPRGVLRAHYHLPFTVTPPPGIRNVGRAFPPGFFAAIAAAGCRHHEVEIYTLGLLAAPEAIPAIFAADIAWLSRAMAADRPA